MSLKFETTYNKEKDRYEIITTFTTFQGTGKLSPAYIERTMFDDPYYMCRFFNEFFNKTAKVYEDVRKET